MRSAETADLARLLAVDPDVPGLRLLLDDDALSAWVADRLGPSSVAVRARRTYLRWKPGAGGVARVRIGGAGDEADVFLAVHHRSNAAKLDKTVLRGGRSVVVVDHDELAVLGLPAADRDLPALGLLAPGPRRAVRRLDAVDEDARCRLHRAARSREVASTLAWKPQRRWVGLLGSQERRPVVLRAYPPHALPGVLQRYRAVHQVLGEDAPAVLGTHLRRGLLAVEHLPGLGLDHVGEADAQAAHRAAGALLATLHGAPVGGGRPDAGPDAPHHAGVGALGSDAECRAVEAAARTVDLLVPEVGGVALARELLEALRTPARPARVLLHGDLSADQVVVDPVGRVGLIDLDEVVVGPASYDLAGITASWWLTDPDVAATRVTDLLDGYAEVRDVPEADELRVRTAAHLLRRAPEAFRAGRPGWRVQVRHAVGAATRALHGDGPTRTGLPGERTGVLL